jgi:hypothetical protein
LPKQIQKKFFSFQVSQTLTRGGPRSQIAIPAQVTQRHQGCQIFALKLTKAGENIPNDLKNIPNAQKYTKWP